MVRFAFRVPAWMPVPPLMEPMAPLPLERVRLP